MNFFQKINCQANFNTTKYKLWEIILFCIMCVGIAAFAVYINNDIISLFLIGLTVVAFWIFYCNSEITITTGQKIFNNASSMKIKRGHSIQFWFESLHIQKGFVGTLMIIHESEKTYLFHYSNELVTVALHTDYSTISIAREDTPAPHICIDHQGVFLNNRRIINSFKDRKIILCPSIQPGNEVQVTMNIH